MIFFFKKKPINVDCFTYRGELIDAFPVDHTVKFIPEWWKQLPKHYFEDTYTPRATMKTCSGFVDYYANGFTTPFWTEALFIIGENGKGLQWRIADSDINTITFHHQFQRGNYLPPSKYQHAKIQSPWCISCKEDIKFVFTGNPWGFDDPREILIPPGIVDFKYQTACHINMFFHPSDETKVVTIPNNTAMINVIPMSERPIKIHNHLISEDEWKVKFRRVSHHPTFINSSRNMKRLRKEQEPKCPFGFGK